MQLKGSAYQHSLCIVRAHFYEFSEEKVKRGDREILAQDSHLVVGSIGRPDHFVVTLNVLRTVGDHSTWHETVSMQILRNQQ